MKKRFIILAVAALLIASIMAVAGGSGLKNLAQNLFNAGGSGNFGENENDDGISIISMETSGFDESEPGSWHLDKSAEWTDLDKAKITFDVKSTPKTKDGRNKDLILVLDISGSMSGEKLDKVKQDSAELVDVLLSDSNNNIALITYGSNSTIVKEFTNNKEEVTNLIGSLAISGATNYNSGLKNVETVMENYVKQDDRDVITLFLTDGYPNEDTPNQVAIYQMLKTKYPYMVIGGIQYEMGQSILQPVIEVSDEQYLASMDTLNNVLFDAAVQPIKYEKYVVEDIIENEYFTIGSIDDIEVTKGEVTLTEENGKQKIIWTLDYMPTGVSAKMTINVKLKEEYIKVDGNYETNDETKVEYKIDDPDIEPDIVETEESPILSWKKYNVIYEPNAPSGKTVGNMPASENYYPFETVVKKQDEPKCDGWNFKGWEIIEEVSKVNEDVFVMPRKNVTIRATWGKPTIKKSMEGTVVVAKEPDVKYAVQIYGINQDVDENGNTLGLTFGPAVGANYNNSYVTHEYEETSSGSGIYNVVIVTHNVADDKTETITTEYLINSSGENVTRTEEEKQKRDINIHSMSWKEIAEKSLEDPTVFTDCMLCGDTKAVGIYLNDTIGTTSRYTQNGDGAGMLYYIINSYYKKWNPNQSDNSAVGTGVTLNSQEIKYGSNARNAGGYSSSHIRATLIGENEKTNIGYAGDVNLSEENCLYSCIDKKLQNVIVAKKVRYVTGSSNTSYRLNKDIVDKIWLFSEREMYGTGKDSGNETEGIGSTGVGYDKFGDTNSNYYMSSYNNTISTNRKLYTEAGSTSNWWLRSPCLNNYTFYCSKILGNGDISIYGYAYNPGIPYQGLAFGFCIR